MTKLPAPLRFKRSLQINILIAFATLLIVTVLIIVSYTYRQNSAAVLDFSDVLVGKVTEAVIEKTTNYLDPAAFMARSSANIPGIEAMSLVASPAPEQYGMQILEMHPQIAGFFVGNEQGDFIFAKRFPDGSIGTQIIDRSQNPATRTWTYRDPAGAVTDVEMTSSTERTSTFELAEAKL